MSRPEKNSSRPIFRIFAVTMICLALVMLLTSPDQPLIGPEAVSPSRASVADLGVQPASSKIDAQGGSPGLISISESITVDYTGVVINNTRFRPDQINWTTEIAITDGYQVAGPVVITASTCTAQAQCFTGLEHKGTTETSINNMSIHGAVGMYISLPFAARIDVAWALERMYNRDPYGPPSTYYIEIRNKTGSVPTGGYLAQLACEFHDQYHVAKTWARYELPAPANVSSARDIWLIVNGTRMNGTNAIGWDTSAASPGHGARFVVATQTWSTIALDYSSLLVATRTTPAGATWSGSPESAALTADCSGVSASVAGNTITLDGSGVWDNTTRSLLFTIGASSSVLTNMTISVPVTGISRPREYTAAALAPDVITPGPEGVPWAPRNALERWGWYILLLSIIFLVGLTLSCCLGWRAVLLAALAMTVLAGTWLVLWQCAPSVLTTATERLNTQWGPTVSRWQASLDWVASHALWVSVTVDVPQDLLVADYLMIVLLLACLLGAAVALSAWVAGRTPGNGAMVALPIAWSILAYWLWLGVAAPGAPLWSYTQVWSPGVQLALSALFAVPILLAFRVRWGYEGVLAGTLVAMLAGYGIFYLLLPPWEGWLYCMPRISSVYIDWGWL